MRFHTVTPLLILATFTGAQTTASAGFSNYQNPFSIPSEGFNATAGKPLSLSWTPTTKGTVTLVLRSGSFSNLEQGITIASNYDNSGSITWTVPDTVVRGSSYAIEIVDDSNPDSNTNYTPFFVVDSSVTETPSSAATPVSTVTLGAPKTSLALTTASPSSTGSSAAGSTGATAGASGATPGADSSSASTTSAPKTLESVTSGPPSTAPGLPTSLGQRSSSSSASGVTTSASSQTASSGDSTASAASASSSAGATIPTQQAFGGLVAFAIAGVVAAL
ncbi:MAG: hypothetical protein M1820_003367 [Bogoriella megaspora]|nr:MAG: hypothetical protein M1820_003367 [Bogoriella megaspora]